MNILIIQEAGRHEKNKEFRESLNLSRAFNRQGINSKVWGLNYPEFEKGFLHFENWADVILIIENYTSSWIPRLELSKSKKLKLFWSIDSHCVLNQHIQLCQDLKVDVLLNSTESYIPYFKGVVKESFWFPNAYPSDLIMKKSNIEKSVDIGFCGNYLNRKSWVNHLDKFNIQKDIFVIGDDMVNAINSYKIHFNRNISNDINYRTFETTGCGTLLLTNYTPGLEKLYEIDKEILVYNDIQDLDKKVNLLLNDRDLRKSIEEAGHKRALKDHTYDNRTKDLVEKLNKRL